MKSSQKELLKSFHFNFMKVQWRRGIRLAIVGDDDIGKRCLLLSYYTNVFQSCIQKVVEEVSSTVQHNEEKVDIQICYYSGQDEFKNLSSLENIKADIFTVSFSLIKPSSLKM
jgi:cell division control protein 42